MITMYHLTGDDKYIKGTHGKGIAARRKSAAAYCRAQAERVLEEVKAQRADGTLRPSRLLREPQSVRAYRYVLNLRLARGVVPPSSLPRDGESPWQMARAWRVPVVWFSDWFDVPLKEGLETTEGF